MSKVVCTENESGRRRNPLDERRLLTLRTCLGRRKNSPLKNPSDACPAGGIGQTLPIDENISMEIRLKSRIAKTKCRILLPRPP